MSSSSDTSSDQGKKSVRYKIVKEMFDTELSYMKQLLLAEHCYIEPVLKLKVLEPEEEKNLTKLKLKKLINEDKILLEKLRKLIGENKWDDEYSCIGKMFLESFKEEFISIYSNYVSNYGQLINWLSELNKNNSVHPFLIFLKKTVPNAENFTLPSLLITPVQRIPRYILLLKVFHLLFNFQFAFFKNLFRFLLEILNYSSLLN